MTPDNRSAPPASQVTPPPTPFQRIGLALLSAVLIALTLWTIRSFLPAVLWAVVMVIAAWPLYRRIQRAPWLARRHTLCAAVFTLVITLIFVAPLLAAAVQVAREAHDWSVWLQNAQRTGIPVPEMISHLPLGKRQITAWWTANLATPLNSTHLPSSMQRGQLLALTGRYGSALVHRLVVFGFTLMTLFFLFRDGRRLTGELLVASRRAFGVRGERIAQRMATTVHGTVSGLVLVGLGEGVILGIAYAIAGVPHPTLLGALTAAAAMLPFCAPILFAGVALYLLASGAVTAAIAILVTGTVVVLIAEHFVRPALIGGSSRLPFLWVLFGILGGAETWGLVGLFIGPALMSAVMLLWLEWTGQPEPAA